MRIRNITASSARGCGCGTWLDHWRSHSRQTMTYCPVLGCIDPPDVGAHVQCDGHSAEAWFILPLCRRHSRQAEAVLDVSDAYSPVLADPGATCQRRMAV